MAFASIHFSVKTGILNLSALLFGLHSTQVGVAMQKYKQTNNTCCLLKVAFPSITEFVPAIFRQYDFPQPLSNHSLNVSVTITWILADLKTRYDTWLQFHPRVVLSFQLERKKDILCGRVCQGY